MGWNGEVRLPMSCREDEPLFAASPDEYDSPTSNMMMQQVNAAALCVVQDMRHRVETATREPTPAVARSLLYLMMQNGLSDEEMTGTFS